MRRSITLVLLVGACQFDPVSGEVGLDAATACAWSYEPSNFAPCAGDPVHTIPALDDGSFTFVTTTGVLAKAGTPIGTFATAGATASPRVWSVDGLVIGPTATLEILGSDPLIIAVHGSASIAGAVTVSARSTTPGAGSSACVAANGGNADNTQTKSGGGGGGGGAFGGDGAAGGEGIAIFVNTLGAPAMPADASATLIPLRGGCGGGAGGEEHASTIATPGRGGGGGGAIQISVREALTLAATARVESNGGGGVGADSVTNSAFSHAGAGGGGGGSGGAIFVEGLSIAIAGTASLCANGGGGGGGSHDRVDGTAGSDGACTVAAASGGGGASGGAGAFATTAPIAGAPGEGSDGGGGGGGGGVGVIRVRAIAGTRPADFIATPPAQID